MRDGSTAVAFYPQALQVLGEPHLEPGDFQGQVRLLQQRLTLPGVFGSNQRFEQVVQVPFNAFPQDETMIAREFASMIATPQNQIVSLRDDNQFRRLRAADHHESANVYMCIEAIFKFDPQRG